MTLHICKLTFKKNEFTSFRHNSAWKNNIKIEHLNILIAEKKIPLSPMCITKCWAIISKHNIKARREMCNGGGTMSVQR